MSPQSTTRLTRGHLDQTTGFSRTRYATSASSTALALRGLQWWRRTRDGATVAWTWVRGILTPAGWLLLAVAAVGLVCGLSFGWVEFVVAGLVAVTLLVLSIPFLFSARA